MPEARMSICLTLVSRAARPFSELQVLLIFAQQRVIAERQAQADLIRLAEREGVLLTARCESERAREEAHEQDDSAWRPSANPGKACRIKFLMSGLSERTDAMPGEDRNPRGNRGGVQGLCRGPAALRMQRVWEGGAGLAMLALA